MRSSAVWRVGNPRCGILVKVAFTPSVLPSTNCSTRQVLQYLQALQHTKRKFQHDRTSPHVMFSWKQPDDTRSAMPVIAADGVGRPHRFGMLDDQALGLGITKAIQQGNALGAPATRCGLCTGLGAKPDQLAPKPGVRTQGLPSRGRVTPEHRVDAPGGPRRHTWPIKPRPKTYRIRTQEVQQVTRVRLQE